MTKNNKVKTIILSILMVFVLFGCSNNEATEIRQIDATTNITWDSSKDSIVVSTVTIKCNDNYYGVVVNDSINFNNDNNYFTTGEGLTISIKEDEDPIGNGTYNYKAKIEDNAYLLVSGNDEDKVKEVFNNVFKTNKESYQMFSHDISSDWINNVIITSDVVSFSNGTDTTYIYQNDGSLSEGCLDGKIEPTVFKKQLRGIDIPITYPEDIDGVSNYIPYGTQTYDHWTNEGYTPYSAYTLATYEYKTEVLSSGTVKHTANDDTENMTNFIILANNDKNVLNLFNDKNGHTQNLYSLKSSTNDNATTLSINDEDLSSIKEIASSVINSENRYHFGIIGNIYGGSYLTQWSESNKDGYFIDSNYQSNLKIASNMSGKLVVPTIKISVPTYENAEALMEYGTRISNINSEDTVYDYTYAMGGGSWLENEKSFYEFAGHGADISFLELLENDVTSLSLQHKNYGMMNQYFLFEGDYVYYFSQNRILSILENVATDDSFGDYAIDMGGNLAPGVQKTMMDTLKRNELSSFTSCFIGKTNSLYQYLETVSNVYYD